MVEETATRDARQAMARMPRAEVVELRIAGQALGILAALLLCFLAQLTVIGGLQHARDQQRAYGQFRSQLATATAPVSPLGPTGHMLPSGTSVAILEIPSLRVREVVGEGTSALRLRSGPGHARDSVLPGQVGASVIMARRAAYGGPFGGINRLPAGAEIIVTTGQGRNTFRVRDVRHANDPLPTALGDGQGRLVLVTADGPPFLPTDVLRVDADLTSPAQVSDGRLPSWVVPEADKTMAGDASALVPVVIWTVILTAAALGVVWIRQRVGRWHAWVIGVPVLGALGVTLADQFAGLLPNLI